MRPAIRNTDNLVWFWQSIIVCTNDLYIHHCLYWSLTVKQSSTCDSNMWTMQNMLDISAFEMQATAHSSSSTRFATRASHLHCHHANPLHSITCKETCRCWRQMLENTSIGGLCYWPAIVEQPVKALGRQTSQRASKASSKQASEPARKRFSKRASKGISKQVSQTHLPAFFRSSLSFVSLGNTSWWSLCSSLACLICSNAKTSCLGPLLQRYAVCF